MKTRILFNLCLLLSLGSTIGQAQPAWSVTPEDFQYSMTVTASVTINGNEVQNTTSIVGAFYNNVCRGTALLQEIPIADNPSVYRAFLTIYSDVPIGEEIEFQFYNEPIGFIHEISTTVDFILDLIMGDIDTPQVLVALPADDNTIPTVKSGFENIVRQIGVDEMVIERGSTTQQLWNALEAPKNPGGTIVGTLQLLDAGDTPIVPGVALVDATMKMKSTAQNGDFTIYTLAVNSSDATLSDLTTSLGTLVPVFDAATLAYTVELPHGSALPTVAGVKTVPFAAKVVTQIGSIPGTATIAVTAEEGTITNTYEVANTYEPSADKTVLEEFYNSTDGPNWTNHNNWLSDELNDWFGVTVSGDRVTQLKLKTNALDGTIPISFWGLDALLLLTLNPNNLSGSLPDDISNLTHLKCLGLSGNAFSGPLPAGMGGLVNLREFYANTNQFSGTLPPEMGQMIKMKYLYLMRNQFEGAVPASFNNMVNLIQLRLDDNQFTGMPDLSALVNLKKLSVQKNKLDFEDLEPLAALAIPSFEYAPQAVIGTEESLTAYAGTTFTYTLTTGGTANTYQWYFDGTAISGQTSATLTIDPVGESDAGDYVCKVKNTLLPALTLISQPIHLAVNASVNNWKMGGWVTDVAQQYARIIWEGNPAGLSKIKIYRETTQADIYTFIGEIDISAPAPDPTRYIYTDLASDPIKHADNYKISFVTDGGVESELSSHQRPVHLTINTNPWGENNLIWTPYEGLEVASYGISVEVHAAGGIVFAPLIDNVSANTTSYTTASTGDLFITTWFKPAPGAKSGTILESRSNKVSLGPSESENFSELLIYPNPMTSQATIQFDNPDENHCKLTIMDLSGKTWLTKDNITTNQITITSDQLPPGIYLIQIIGAEYATGKIIVH